MTVLREILSGVDKALFAEDGFDPDTSGEQIVILAQLHCLPSTVELFGRLLKQDVDIRPDRVVIVPKPYSSIDSALREIREWGFLVVDKDIQIQPGRYDRAVQRSITSGCIEAFRICQTLIRSNRRARLIILDDGGILTETWWRLADLRVRGAFAKYHLDAEVLDKLNVVSIQQTTSGILRKPHPAQLTKIDISRSAAKKIFESRVIAAGVLKKVRDLQLLNGGKAGVVGVGTLGSALVRDLLGRGLRVYVYDREKVGVPSEAIFCHSLKFLLRESEIIFGCTGRNFLRSVRMSYISTKKPIHFISCSSRDIEFKELLRLGKQGPSPFDRVTVQLPTGQVHYIENGGFPINFDRKKEQEGPDDIALTRALVFTGILQAISLKRVRLYKDALMLSPSAQRHVVATWMRCTGSNPEKFGVHPADFDSLSWWRDHSGGLPVADQIASPE
jgi:hypothetical protein